jgi:hypothetical protein
MTVRHLAIALLLSLVLVAVATASLWTWTGNGADDEWGTSGNWTSDCQGICPQIPGTSDDVEIPTGVASWDIDMDDNYTVDDVVIKYATDFNDAGTGAPTLTTDTVTINGASVVRVGNVVITAE